MDGRGLEGDWSDSMEVTMSKYKTVGSLGFIFQLIKGIIRVLFN